MTLYNIPEDNENLDNKMQGEGDFQRDRLVNPQKRCAQRI